MFESVIQGVLEKTAERVQIQPGDYKDRDGLWVCGKCNTPKQVEVVLFDEVCRPLVLCKCENERVEREKEEQRRREAEKKIAERQRNCFPDARMAEWTMAADDGQDARLSDVIRKYAGQFADFLQEGKGLLLYGGCGSGKTYAACMAANAVIYGGYSAYMSSFARLINTLQSTQDRQGFIDRLAQPDLLVLDDLGAMRDTGFGLEQAYNIVDTRYRSGKPMIVTTNLALSELKSPETIEAGRIYDRILERCFPVEANGGNRRRETIRREYEDFKGRLGL